MWSFSLMSTFLKVGNRVLKSDIAVGLYTQQSEIRIVRSPSSYPKHDL